MKPKFVITILLILVIFVFGGLIYSLVKKFNYKQDNNQTQVLECLNQIANSSSFPRNIEARLSIYSRYQPYQIDKSLVSKLKTEPNPNSEPLNLDEEENTQASRGGKKNKPTYQYPGELKLTVARLIFSDIKTPTPESARGVAAIYISQGEFDEAIDELETEAKRTPNNPLLLNDLATAYFARGEYTDQPKDFVYALSTIDEAVAADPKNPAPAILFNRALMLKKLFLDRLAKEAWQTYLAVETNPDWQAEARKHLDELNAPSFEQIWQAERTKLSTAVINNDLNTANAIIEKYPHPSRMYAIDDLLPAWADAYLAEKTVDAEQQLKIAHFIGEKLVVLQEDKLVQDMVKAIESLSNKAIDDKKRHDLATAHQFYGKAKYFLERSEIDNSLINLKSAANIFNKLNDTASANHMYLHIARAKADTNQSEALNITKQVLSISKLNKYPYLLARACITISYIYQNKVELSKAIEFSQKATKILEVIEDFPDTAIAYSNLCSVFSTLKDQEKALQCIYKSLKQYSQSMKRTRYINDLNRQGEQVLFLGKLQTAIYFYDEAIQLATESKMETSIILSLIRKAKINQYLNNKHALFEDIKLIREYQTTVSDEEFQKLIKDEVNIIEAKSCLSDEPEKAISVLSKSIKRFEQIKDNNYKTQAYLSRAQAYLQTGKIALAEVDLLAVIDEIENQRKAIKEENYRISFFEEPISVYEELAKLKITHNNEVEAAFNYTERAHARTLLDEIEAYRKTTNISKLALKDASTSLRFDQIRKQLPQNVVLLEYLVLKDQIFIWVIKNASINFVQTLTNRVELNKFIADYSDSMEKGNTKEQLKIFSDRLYQELITPITNFISPEDTLVIIPDKELYKLPYAALTNPTTNKYLIEERPISYSPSATVFINSLKRDLLLTNQTNKKTLVIGNPVFSRETFPDLYPLSGAAREAEKVAKIYPNSYLLKGETATKKEFAKLCSQYNTIHFAGHAVANSKSPLYSVMVMAAEKNTEEGNSALYAYELYGYNFDKTQLIVLAACQTAKGKLVNGEGVLSITRPFLAKGVPSVIASLWNADDSAAEALFVEFHKKRNAGENIVSALREAQLSLLNSDNTRYHLPKTWAPFILFGADSTTKIFN